MAARITHARSLGGFSLANTMIAVAMVSIAAIGTSQVRYHASLDSRKATMNISGMRAAELLCQSWRAVQGVETYDPTTSIDSELGLIQYSGIAPAPSEASFTVLGSYRLVLNDGFYYATLSWQDISVGLRALNVSIAWACQNPDPDNADYTDSSFQVTAYTITP